VEVVRYDAAGWGVGELVCEGPRLLYHELPVARPEQRPNLPQGIPEIPAISLARDDVPVCAGSASELTQQQESALPRLVQRLLAYFEGEEVGFDDVELELDWCTPFQRSLLESLRAVPRGEVVTYGELAALAGRPNAQRAAGSFCARNRFSIVVPCHRVVSASGLGDYGSLGPEYKRRLLELEGVDVAV
jgi:O-6-methylguanine DNA methyltransferase